MSKKKKKRNKSGHVGNIMTKSKVHKNEDKKIYNRRDTKRDEKEGIQ